MNHSQMSALELYERLKQESTTLPDGEESVVYKRVRLARLPDGSPAVDLSVAEPGCPHCGGTGLRAPLDLPGGDSIPVVCRCVKRAGGVKEDLLDRLLDSGGRRRVDAKRRP